MVTELDFLKKTVNFRAFAAKLDELGIPSAAVSTQSERVARAWFQLADQHLGEASHSQTHSPLPMRTVYSRSYYSAYSASKAVRYLFTGEVSLRGDDHGKAKDLPSDFPDQLKWSRVLSTLYEDRLRADYDNWTSTPHEFNRQPQDALDLASEFLDTARQYIASKFQLSV